MKKIWAVFAAGALSVLLGAAAYAEGYPCMPGGEREPLTVPAQIECHTAPDTFSGTPVFTQLQAASDSSGTSSLSLCTDPVSDVVFAVPRGWEQVDLEQEDNYAYTITYETDSGSDPCTIRYSSKNLQNYPASAQFPEEYLSAASELLAQYSLSEILSKQDVADLFSSNLDPNETDIRLTHIHSKEFYAVRALIDDSSDSNLGIEAWITVDSHSFYLFLYSGLFDSAEYQDFEFVLSSFSPVSSPSGQNVSVAQSARSAAAFFHLFASFLVFVVPIFAYKAIACKSIRVSRKKSCWIIFLYFSIAEAFLSLVMKGSFSLGLSGLLWCALDYFILRFGSEAPTPLPGKNDISNV